MYVHRLKQMQPIGKIAWYDAKTKQFPFHKVAISTDLLDSFEHWNIKVKYYYSSSIYHCISPPLLMRKVDERVQKA